MAAASSTSMPRIRSRTRRRCRTISTSSPCSASRRRWSTPSARWSATAARAGPSWPRPRILLLVGIGAIYWAETYGNPILTALGVDPALGNMEGKEVRFGQAMTAAYAAVTTGLSDGGVNGMHGSLHRARRPGADVPDPARRSAARRRRLRPLRHGGVRHPRRLRRRPDGRPHARTSRQEDRKPRDEVRHARGAHPAAGDPRLHRGFGHAALRGGERRHRRPARPVARSSTPSPRPPATTARPSAA